MARTYADAVTALNTLQSNFAVVDAIRKSGRKMNEQAIPEMIEWLRKIGYHPTNLNVLDPIHIAGTKGKGSTAAFISSILNCFRKQEIPNAPTKIGLYTSPHLRFVRERIQINGAPLTEEKFTRYFFETWDRLESSAANAGEDPKAATAKPVYFRFLTLMAFHTYLSESVDCAIIECGIGGAYDSTNIIPRPAITGITSLGIDHVGVLGNSIEEIAWHKAGVMKTRPSTEEKLKCFTPDSQPSAAKTVLSKVANEQSTDLIYTSIAPEIASGTIPIGLSASFQQTNASLALAMTNVFLSSRGVDISTPEGQSCTRQGLQSVTWPGRCDTRTDATNDRITWCIDGGHTLESIELAGRWFGEQLQTRTQTRLNPPPSTSDSETKTETSTNGVQPNRSFKKILIFNQQTRDAPSLATALYNTLSSTISSISTTSPSTNSTSSQTSPFDTVLFTTNQTYTTTGFSPDLIATNTDSAAVQNLTVQKQLAEVWKRLDGNADVRVVRTIEEAVGIVRSNSDDEGGDGDVEKVVLVTGSLHLVGGCWKCWSRALKVLRVNHRRNAKNSCNTQDSS